MPVNEDRVIVLRKQHTCQIRRSTPLDSPLCGEPAFEVRTNLYNISLWACAEHLYWVRADRWQVAHPTLMLALRAAWHPSSTTVDCA